MFRHFSVPHAVFTGCGRQSFYPVRTPLSKRKRFEIFKRDSFKCQYCGSSPPSVILHVDHVLAVSSGGDDSMENLVTSCQPCNSGKSDVPLKRLITSSCPDIQLERERLEQFKRYQIFLAKKKYIENEWFTVVSQHWIKREEALSLNGYPAEKWQISGAREQAVRRFVKILPVTEITDAIDAAYDQLSHTCGDERRLKYFCGICWKKVKLAGGLRT